MVKRAKLTLEHTRAKVHFEEEKQADIPESVATEAPVASGRQGNIGKMLIMAGLTIISLIIFKQKII